VSAVSRSGPQSLESAPGGLRSAHLARFVDHEIDLVIDRRLLDRIKPRDAEAFEDLLWAAGLRAELSLLLNENSVVSASLDADFAVD
jgi:hypothetical protein